MKGTTVTLRVERLIPATPEQVFDAWTTATEFARWWTPPMGRCIDVSINLQLGGRYAIVNEFADGSVMTIHGEYVVIDRPSQLSFTWSTTEDDPGTEVVTVTFEAAGTATRLTISHDKIENPEVKAGHAAGWDSCLNGLTTHIAARG